MGLVGIGSRISSNDQREIKTKKQNEDVLIFQFNSKPLISICATFSGC